MDPTLKPYKFLYFLQKNATSSSLFTFVFTTVLPSVGFPLPLCWGNLPPILQLSCTPLGCVFYKIPVSHSCSHLNDPSVFDLDQFHPVKWFLGD